MHSTDIEVVKRDGRREKLDIRKIQKVVNWACEGLRKVSASELELAAIPELVNGVKTSEIHSRLISAGKNLISPQAPDYQYALGRLLSFDLRKRAYGRYEPCTVAEQLERLKDTGFYDSNLYTAYTPEELEVINGFVDHNRDNLFAYAGLEQLQTKYLLQDRTGASGEIYESPQMAFILLMMTAFINEDKDKRLAYIKEGYDFLSTLKISLPTPIMSGLRTPERQYSSCVTIDVGDSLSSISQAVAVVMTYIAQKAGIGLNLGRLRPMSSPIGKGKAKHTGVVPFYRTFESATLSCSQGGVRPGAATVHYMWWHPEIKTLMGLKNGKQIEAKAVRQLDYSIQYNRYFVRRYREARKGGRDYVTLFSPHEAKGLYEAFFADQDLFEKLYEQYEQDESLQFKERVPVEELLLDNISERITTGRIYWHFVDHSNTHSAFLDTIYQSNLCQEINIPTQPFDVNVKTGEVSGEIGLCTLAAINVGLVESDEEMARAAAILVRILDNLLDYQDYPNAAAELAKERRSLGIGIINYAYALAKRGLRYSDGSAFEYTHQLWESVQFHLLTASKELAKERGRCGLFHRTKYSQGLLPIDHYEKRVDSFCQVPLRHDWEGLRKEIMQYGLRHSTLTAQMPSETSSLVSNSTNGIDPALGLLTNKQNKDFTVPQLVPEPEKYGHNYELMFDIRNNDNYLKLFAIMQKFIDQSISINTHYNALHYTDGKIPMENIVMDFINAYRYGLKNIYYLHNYQVSSSDMANQSAVSGCDESGACKL